MTGYGKDRTSSERKGQPIGTGLLGYFPHACAAVAECSRKGNDKHNPGEPLHWAKEKSTDEADCVARHLTDALAEGPLTLNEDGVPHVVSLAWRALAFAERALTGDDRWKSLPKPTPAAIEGVDGGRMPVTIGRLRAREG